ncbi:MAG: hypothetical protein ACTHML_10020 [Ginsengibacter sp.]
MTFNSISFWLNAFIPNSIRMLKGETSVLPIPFILNGIPIPTIRFFAGDQREFSDDVSASSRMHSEIRIEEISSDNPTIAYQKNICGESLELEDSKNIVTRETARNDRMQFTNLGGSQTVYPEGGVIDGIHGSVQVDLFASANLPLLLLAPDIE